MATSFQIPGNVRRFGAAAALLLFVSCGSDKPEPPEKTKTHAGALTQLTNQIGRLTSTGNSKRRTALNYDALGRAKATGHALEGTEYIYTNQYGYPKRALPANAIEPGTILQSTRLPDGELVSYEYDNGGGQQKVTAGSEVIVHRVRRNAKGQTISVEHGNGVRSEHRYNDEGDLRLRQIVSTHLPSGRVLQAYEYAFDGAGNVKQIRDYCNPDTDQCPCDPSVGASCMPDRLSRAFDYDEMDRLVQVRAPAGSIAGLPRGYAYDAIGNLTSKDGVPQTYGADGKPHALRSAAGVIHSYDQNGNLVATSAGLSVIWDAQNMPAMTQKGSQYVRKYFQGDALWKKIEGETVIYYLPSIRIENGRMRKYYGSFAERDPDAAGALRFYHGDHLGSSTLVTDAAANVVSRAAYLPYGEDDPSFTRQNDFTPKYQFNFKERERISELYDYGARMYNPATGRWLSPDTSTVDGLNRYAYVANNPLKYVDPTGNQKKKFQGYYIGQYDSDRGGWDLRWIGSAAAEREVGDIMLYLRFEVGSIVTVKGHDQRLFRLQENNMIQAWVHRGWMFEWGAHWSEPFDMGAGPGAATSAGIGFVDGLLPFGRNDEADFISESASRRHPWLYLGGSVLGGMALGKGTTAAGGTLMPAGPTPYLRGLYYGRSGVYNELAIGSRRVVPDGAEIPINVPYWTPELQTEAAYSFFRDAGFANQAVRLYPGGKWTRLEWRIARELGFERRGSHLVPR